MPRNNRVLLLHTSQPLKPRAQAPSKRLIQPAAPFDWSEYDEVRFIFHIASVTGAPTGWSIKPRLRIAQTSASGYQDANPVWKTLTPAEALPYIAEDTWPADLDQSTPLPAMWIITVTHPFAGMAIDLGESGADALTITGGTNPAILASLVAYPKGS